MSEQRWVAAISSDDRPGTLTALAEVFSTRGVSFDSLSTGAVEGAGAAIMVTFAATARRQHLLARTLERLAVVRSVTVRAADDPCVRAVAALRMPAGVDLEVPSANAVRREGQSDLVLVEGTYAEVDALIGTGQARGAVMTAFMILDV